MYHRRDFSTVSSSLLLLPLLLFTTPASSQYQTGSNTTKRGLPYHDPAARNEYSMFFGGSSPLTWYYNWGPYPSRSAPRSDAVEFFPLIHGTDDLDRAISTVESLPHSPPHPRLLTFNEPDGSVESGGSAISPPDAAAAYIDSIVPLRPQFQLSHPSTTGTGSGLDWLAAFNRSCFELDPTRGCPADFVATHFYGDFPALAAWLGQLHAFYPGLAVWITEFALPQADANATLRMMRQALPYLDALDYVAGYAWFGLFRASEANNWTGPGPSLLDDNGGLTALGVEYLGGEDRGFHVGMSSIAADGGMGSGVVGLGSLTKGQTRLLGVLWLAVSVGWWMVT